MRTKSHNAIRSQLIFFLEGKLTGNERERVAAHLQECADCRAFYEELQASMAILDENKQIEPGDYFYAGIKNRIEARHTARSAVSRILQPAFFVLLLAIGVRFGIWVGNQAQVTLPETEQAALLPFDDLTEEPIEDFLLNLQ